MSEYNEDFSVDDWIDNSSLHTPRKDHVFHHSDTHHVSGRVTPRGVRVLFGHPSDLAQWRTDAQQLRELRDRLAEYVATRSALHKQPLPSEQETLSILSLAAEHDRPEQVFHASLREMARTQPERVRDGVLDLLSDIQMMERSQETSVSQQLLSRRLADARLQTGGYQTKIDVRELADDLDGYLEPSSWNDVMDLDAYELYERITELDRQMLIQAEEAQHDSVAELCWHALKRERDEYSFLMQLQVMALLHPEMQDKPWYNSIRASEPQERNGLYRLIRDVYLDPHGSDEHLDLSEHLLERSDTPESLRRAARRLRQDISEGNVPSSDEVLARRRALMNDVSLPEGRLEEASPFERGLSEAAPLTTMEYRKDYMKDRLALISTELGMNERDVLRLKRLCRFMRLQGIPLAFTWRQFVLAGPHTIEAPPRSWMGRLRYRLKERYQPRQKMLRNLRRQFKLLPQSSQGYVRSQLPESFCLLIEL